MRYVHLGPAVALLASSAACHAGSEACIEPRNKVTLRGSVSERQVYGPPNFGETPETDQRRTILVFLPSEPIHLCGESSGTAGDPPETNVTDMQLINYSRRGSLGTPTSVTGSLARADNAYHYTRVIMISD